MKRTPTQELFDLAVHGWSFCNARMLRSRIAQAEGIASRLLPDDPRHDTLTSMREKMTREVA